MLYCRLNDLSVWSFFDFFWNGRWNEIFHRRFWQVITVCHSNLCYVIRMVVRLMCKLVFPLYSQCFSLSQFSHVARLLFLALCVCVCVCVRGEV